MRQIKPPVRFSDPVYTIAACKKQLLPFEGQPRKWRQARRYPELVVQQSDDLASPTPDLAYLSQKTSRLASLSPRTSERSFRRERRKSSRTRYGSYTFETRIMSKMTCSLSRETDIFEQITLPAVAWIQNLPHRLIWIR